MTTDWHFLQEASSAEDAVAAANISNVTLKAWINAKLEELGVRKNVVVARSGLNQTYGYQIMAGLRTASRDKLIQLAFGLGLDVGDCSTMMSLGGVSPLSDSCRRDVIIAWAIQKGLDVTDCNSTLKHLREKPLVEHR
ncbi:MULTISPECIES: hypothetical protein [Atopobiaceae]|uniref:XRE family transcriptional regulator n=1 Tax=Parafannyhessea umbonata TaxID=604330 RepID=A0A1H9Q413_9ACTN|nr:MULTISPECIES: hypothetical protein [Atopobiaceae]SEH48960.1 hypothetical protein SAMN05216447_103170 [Parafannyhessea umbonata]SER55207.1 hypothetical protein SAMN05216446_1293 [Parafannyhessea umbonata]SJZ66432.1 hypothetical protein SAMN06298223_1031 [Olsenella sp. KH1P3]